MNAQARLDQEIYDRHGEQRVSRSKSNGSTHLIFAKTQLRGDI